MNLEPYKCYPFFTALPVWKRPEGYLGPQAAARQRADRLRDAPGGGDPEVRIWAVPISKNGQNAYFVATPHQVLHEILYSLRRFPEDRRVLEVIEDGRPCHFYVDVDVNRRDNPDIDEARFRVLLCRIHDVVREGMGRIFCVDPAGIWFVETDSSKEHKFSRHITFHMPGDRPLESTVIAHEVAHRIFAPCQDEFSVRKRTKGGWVTEMCVDMGVYTKNRLMRTAWSNKFGDAYRPLARVVNPGEASERLMTEEELWDCPEEWLDTLVVPTGKGLTAIPWSLTEFQTPPIRSSGSSTGPRAPRTTRVPSSEFVPVQGGALRAWVRALPEYQVQSVAVMPTFGISVTTSTRECPFLGRAHRSNSLYLWFQLSRGTYEVRCFDPSAPCCGNATAPRPWTPAMHDAVVQTMQIFFASHTEHDHAYSETSDFLVRGIDTVD